MFKLGLIKAIEKQTGVKLLSEFTQYVPYQPKISTFMRIYKKVKRWRGEIYLLALWLFKLLSITVGFSRFYRGLLVRLIQKTELFDASYYLENHADVAQSGKSALHHYVSIGNKAGYAPMALFDPEYYATHSHSRTKRVNSLLHYVYVGQYRRISPSPWFDVGYYLANNKDVHFSGIEPLRHYLKWGGFEGRSPCPQFDSAYYLRSDPELALARVNPLLHYLLYGRLQERRILPDYNNNTMAVSSSLPDEAAWQALKPRVANANIDVIVPVYKGKVETLRCLYSVLAASSQSAFELIVINDASPDAELTRELEKLASSGLFTLLMNETNRGFVGTVNRGMQLHANRDVLLLNADTEVYDGWLDRLHHAAENARVATVTPLSNNATICSYPRFLHDNPFPLELSYAELNALTAEVNAGVSVTAPTGVGFCLYINRACLNAVGLFDEQAFGKGYGEENDFCQRALQQGWQNIIATDVFVRHWGAASFQGERNKRVQIAMSILAQRYPSYHADIGEFIQRDPLNASRQRLDWARLRRLRTAKNILIVTHNRGGGTERHIQEDIQQFMAAGYGVFLLRPLAKKSTHAVLSHAVIKSLANSSPFAVTELETLVLALQSLSITEIHSHSLVDFIADMPLYLSRLVKMLSVAWEINLHDYEIICPRVNLADENGRYCGEPDETGCNHCLLKRGSDFDVTDIAAWRAMYSQVLPVANKVLVPDTDVAKRLAGYFPTIHFTISPHEELHNIQLHQPQLQADEKLRIVVIGAISKLKGFDVLLACAEQVKKHRLPLEFIVMGYSMNDHLLTAANVRLTGKYQEQDALQQLTSLQAHVVWLPSTWPETYSYTLSLALTAGYPTFAFNIGAIAQRLAALGMCDMLMPLAMADTPTEIIHQFDSFRLNCLTATN